jgi:hypothetical protein
LSPKHAGETGHGEEKSDWYEASGRRSVVLVRHCEDSDNKDPCSDEFLKESRYYGLSDTFLMD